MAKKNDIIANCKKYLGKPYVWGGESMSEGGYDCSGYAYNVMKDSNMKVSRTTADGFRSVGTKIDIAQKDVSDLLFFGKNNKATHIAFYAGNGMMYESSGNSTNTKSNPGMGVILSKITRNDLMEVRRIADDIILSNVSTPTSANTTSNKTIGIAFAKTTMKVRSEAHTDNRTSKTLGYVNKGESVEVIEVLSNGWYKIKYSKASCGYAYTSNAGGNYYTYTAKTSTTIPSVNTTPTTSNTMYRVQVGAYSVKANADRKLTEVKKHVSDAFITKVGNMYKVQVGAYSVRANADKKLAEMKKLGYNDAFITT